MKFERLAEIYECIGQGLRDQIQEKWLKACVRVEFDDEDGAIYTWAFYTTPDSPHEKTWFIFEEMDDLFTEMRGILEKDRSRWLVCKFELEQDGDFEVQFDYEDGSRWEHEFE